MANNGFFRIMVSNHAVFPGDTDRCKEEIIKLIDDAADKEASLLVLPELSVSSASCGDLFLSSMLLESAAEAANEIAVYTKEKSIAVCFSFPYEFKGVVYSAAAIAAGGKLLGIVPLGAKEGERDSVFESYSGTDDETILRGVPVPFGNGLLFRCTENDSLSISVERNSRSLSEASIVLIPDSSEELFGNRQYIGDYIRYRSRKDLCACVYVSSGEGETTSEGVFSSYIAVAEEGKMLSESSLFSSKSVIVDIDLGTLAYRRRWKTSVRTEHDETTVIPFSLEETAHSSLLRKIDRMPFVPADRTEMHERAQTALAIQGIGLAERMKRTGIEKAVIGVSGGLDSTLALLAAVEAIEHQRKERTNVIAVSMPCFGTSSRTKGNAQRLCSILGVDFRLIDISAVVEEHLNNIGHDGKSADAAYENAQARERTQVLMDISNMENGLVVGTGDMSEAALGWCTFNGDHMSMYNVNCNLTKTFIRAAVSDYADNCGNAELKAVLKDIVNTPVSPELKPSSGDDIAQKTEEILGPYEVHDFFLYHFVRNGAAPVKMLSLAELAFKEVYDRDSIRNWLVLFLKRFSASQFKRNCVPDGPSVGSISLSPNNGWMMPSDLSFNCLLKEITE